MAGGALGKAGLASRTPLGMTTLIVANNFPDVDVAVFATDTLAMSFRRGWTHGVLAQATLPIALTAIVIAGDRLFRRNATERVKPREILLLSYIGVLCHVFLDFVNSYGVRLLMPFSERWFYGDALYVVDPIMYLTLGLGWWLASRRKEVRPARIALTAAAVYIAVMLASNALARGEVREQLHRARRSEDTRFMVTPVFGNPVRREVIIDLGHRYEKGSLRFEPWPHFRPDGYGVNKGFDLPEALRALQLPRARAFLRWSRFPFLQVDHNGVWLNDYRYSGAGPYGWSAVKIEGHQ
ncbi:MAG TPA: metal-dependent hydrolase [Vicinamibacterales bacterium]|nr:metal-dependent hydrolase [Vicinamibacterales bacterium]